MAVAPNNPAPQPVPAAPAAGPAPRGRRLRRWLGRLALLTISLLGTCVLLEVVLRRQVPPPFTTVVRTTTVDGLPYQLRPNFSTNYFGNQVDINGDGFRGPETPARKAGTRRIALVGDSVVFGHVPSDQTLTVHLADAMKGRGEEVQALNCGVPGYDAFNVAVMLEAQVLKLTPDVVVYVFCFNDPPPAAQPPKAEISPDHVVDELNNYPFRSALLEFVGRTGKGIMRRVGLASSGGYNAELLANWQGGGEGRLRDAVRKMNDLCAARGVPFLVVIGPAMCHPDANPYRDVEDGLKKACGELNVPCHDLRSAFPAGEDLSRYRVTLFDGHPNGQANQIMAADLAQKLLPGGNR